MADDHERLASTLDHVADVADEAAAEQRQAAKVARGAARRRRDGGSSDAAAESTGRVLAVLGRSAERLAGAAAGLRRSWAAALADDGLSIRQIGERLGVTHQRVSALLTRHRQGDASQSRR